jgi:hypothetical protein
MPAAGGSSVKTRHVNNGSPFFKTRRTMENRGMSVSSASVTHAQLRILLQSERISDRAESAVEKKSVDFARAVLMGLNSRYRMPAVFFSV